MLRRSNRAFTTGSRRFGLIPHTLGGLPAQVQGLGFGATKGAGGFGSTGRPQGKEYEPKAQSNDRFQSRKHISSEDFNEGGGGGAAPRRSLSRRWLLIC